MTSLLRSEWIKLTTVKSPYMLTLVALALGLLIAGMVGSFAGKEPASSEGDSFSIEIGEDSAAPPADSFAPPPDPAVAPVGVDEGIGGQESTAPFEASNELRYNLASDLLEGVVGFSLLMMLILAGLIVSSEYRAGTIRTSFLAAPDRIGVLVAKAILAALVTALALFVISILSLGLGDLLSNLSLDWTAPETVRRLWGIPLFGAVGAILAVGLGAIVRQSAGLITVLLVWILAVETIFPFIPKFGDKVAPYMPFNNANYWLSNSGPPDVYHWGPEWGIAYFAAVALAVFVVGAVVTTKRDA